MKINKSALVGLALSAISFASHAGFTMSLSGPSVLQPGHSGTFELTVIYTPRTFNPLDDLGTGVPGGFIWSQSAGAAFRSAQFYKDGIQYHNTFTIPGVPSYYGPINASQPSIFRSPFAWSAVDAGSYEMILSVRFDELISHYQTPLCIANPRCADHAQLNGTDDYSDVIYTNFNVEVTPSAPIPEPETFAMMLAGLGLMGAIARRRNNGI